MRLAVADEVEHPLYREQIAGILAGAREAGIEAQALAQPGREHEFDALLLFGHPHLYPRLLGAPEALRSRRRVAWYGENLPLGAARPVQNVARALPSARLLDIVRGSIGRAASAAARDRLMRWREAAAIERELGKNLRELRGARSMIDELVVTSPNRVVGARRAGWGARIAPFGYHAESFGPIVDGEGRRDIDVLFVGRDIGPGSRRARWLAEFRRQLGERPNLVVVEHGLYGSERRALVARTKVVVDIHRVPFNSTGLRYIMATAGGAALVNEETHDDWLERRHDYLIEVPRPELAGAVHALLEDEPRRRGLVEAGQRLLTTSLAMTNCLRLVVSDQGAGTMAPTTVP